MPVKRRIISPKLTYQVFNTFLENPDWKIAIDKITLLVRSTLVYDHLVIYTLNPDQVLDVKYAKATGRGKKAEADVSWGETTANQVVEKNEIIIQKPNILENHADRLQNPYLIGVPMMIRGHLIGVMIMVRFGGPVFTRSDLSLVEFIAQNTALAIYQTQEQEAIQKQVQQVQLKEDFISTISHELRSPLGFIKGYTTTLLRADTSWDQSTQHEFLQIIEQEADYLQELIENLLDSARLQSGQMKMNFQPVRLDAVIKDVITRLHMRIPDQNINLDTPQPLPTILGDPRRLAQVIENLLANAAKYAPKSPVSITIKPGEAGVDLFVHDNGPGIPKKYLPYIFDRFFRNPDQSPNIHGSGLGLFICKQIIQAHSGTIEAISNVGQGTEMHIFIPFQ
jgi:signal transduction histidine kinase